MEFKTLVGLGVLGIGLLFFVSKPGLRTDETATINYKSRLLGLWERKGYGEILAITSSRTERYEFTRSTCIKGRSLSQKMLAETLKHLVIAEDERSFSSLFNRPFRRNYIRLTSLPAPCQPKQLLTQATPMDVFEHFWHTFNDYYAFFSEHHIDWQQYYQRFRPQVTQTTTNDELFTLLSTMIAPLNDGHISLESEDDYFSPAKESRFLMSLQHAFKQQDQFDDFDDYQQVMFERITKNQQRYLIRHQHAGGKEGDVVQWGRIKNKEAIAYVSVSRMSGLTKTSDEDNVSSTDDEKATEQIFTRILHDLRDTRAMIIDMRLNEGGYDAVSMKIASYFAKRRQLVLKKYVRANSGHSKTVEAYLEPAEITYKKPVVILTSEETISAAEIFLVVMRALPQVTLIGERSNGAFSDELQKGLPNGWEFQLSNEVYLDYQGKNYEVVGVPVDNAVRALSLATLKKERDPVLEQAIAWLR